MLTLEQIVKGLQDKNFAAVSRATGISRQKIWAIATGATANPGILTAQKLSDYLESRE